jgi:hypothetical protein
MPCFFLSRAKVADQKIILVFGPGENGSFGQVLSKTKNPLEAFENGRSRGETLRVFFFKTFSNFEDGFLKLRFFFQVRTGQKKYCSFFSLQYFLCCVRQLECVRDSSNCLKSFWQQDFSSCRQKIECE